MSSVSAGAPQVHLPIARPPRVRLADLARLAGVSVATVSRSLQDSPLINYMTKMRVRQLAADHGYHLEGGTLTATVTRRPTIAVMTPPEPDSHGQFLGGLIASSQALRCNLLFSNLRPDALRDLPAHLEMTGADAFIFFESPGLLPALNELASGRKSRFIVWGNGADGQYLKIGPDNFGGAFAATQHLVRAGCKRIAYFGDTHGEGCTQRFMGYLTALSQAGQAIDDGLVLSSLDETGTLAFDGLLIADEALVAHTWRADLTGVHVVAWGNAPTPEVYMRVDFNAAEAAQRLLRRLIGGEPVERGCERMPLTLRSA